MLKHQEAGSFIKNILAIDCKIKETISRMQSAKHKTRRI